MMLDTAFERIPGDIGNPESFDYPVVLQVVPGASVERALGGQDDVLADLFAEHAQRLVDSGVRAITTSCGFLARYQKALASRIAVNFASSALCLLPDVGRHYGAVGVITADRSRLGEAHFLGCGAAPPEAIIGMEDRPHFRSSILRQETRLSADRIREETVAAALQLQKEHPQLDVILLECTNLPPYRRDVEHATGLPVVDALTLSDALAGHRSPPWR
ncbi:aspartate/glutamate racemase family protein [Kocuria coralli]|uniref:Aspartate/glutamate racemase family protein n=1 Tax=Kocuria coralli TaxID=1461025 RepID=A0A5J5KWK1_9MICC|nr:aspartate/glutamate racemase family protein [Kocuria coralli]KAA9394053.1 aspartate/glutamate racemase family protein [Kocuria coralli]